MNIPFASLFGKIRASLRSASPAEPVPAGLMQRSLPAEKKTGGEKLSKTVMPNTTRTIGPLDPFDVASGHSRTNGLPPAVAIALEPKVERTIALELADVMGQIPENYLKPLDPLETKRHVLVHASEIEKGMAIGKPAISLTALYEQMPEIFQQSVPPTEMMQVPLPIDKVLEQINSAHVRTDQERDQAVPQVETPILKVTLEDTEKFGTSLQQPETSDLPPVKVEPASARSLANAEPETAVRQARPASSPRAPISLSIPLSPSPEVSGPKPPNDSAKPTRVPFQLPPNGTDAPAPERVPASSGPSVPIRSAKPTFRMSAPSDSLRPKLTLVPGTAPETEPEEDEFFAPPPARKAQEGDLKISLRLQPILESLPPFQLHGNPSTVPAEVEVQFPFSLIQPQLAIGRVSIPPRTFQAAMPREYRELLMVDPGETPVHLPLHEVLKKIPQGALEMRRDQVEAETAEGAFETPFSIKAKEDAARFAAAKAAVPAVEAKAPETAEPPSDAAAKTEAEEKKDEPQSEKDGDGTKAEAAKADGTKADEGKDHRLEADATKADATKIEDAKAETGHEHKHEVHAGPGEEIDAKEVVARARKLPGVAGCLVTFADGLSLAGNLPEEFAVGGLCAMAPSLLQRMEKHMLDTKLGAMNALTLRGENSALSFFKHGNIYLAALHEGTEQLSGETHSQLAALTKDLSRTFAQPETTNVDH